MGRQNQAHDAVDTARARRDHQAELSAAAEAGEIYRNLRKQAENTGYFDIAWLFFVRGMTMRRYQMRRWSLARLFSKAVDLFCGYCERSFRVVLFSVALVVGCAMLYFSPESKITAASLPMMQAWA